MEEESEKKLQDLIHKAESMMSMVTEHIGTGIKCSMSDEDRKTLVDLIAMCLDFRMLYMKEKRNNEKILNDINNNYISKNILENYLKEVNKKYQIYKKEVDNNENLRSQMWKHLGEKDILEIILDKPRKLVTLD